MRLASNIIYTDINGAQSLVPASHVAQYAAKAVLFYNLTDDGSSGNITYVFSATPGIQDRDHTFHGALTVYTNGQPSSIIPMKCTLTTI